MVKEKFYHRRLDCGMDFAALPLEGRQTTAFEFRVLAGMAEEPADKLGVARIVEETISKGTAKRSAQEVSDAFDVLGAQRGSGVGRETFSFRCNCLPEFLDDALALHAEMFRTPSFPAEFCDVAINLSLQELTAMEDDPDELARRLITPHVYGDVLGRHELGNAETLKSITRQDILDYWKRTFASGRMQFSIGGIVDPERTAKQLDKLFVGFGDARANGPVKHPAVFKPGTHHHHKELDQQQILIGWPGVTVSEPEYFVERVLLAILGDGMSSRLFTEVREKQGLVYWVGAWHEHPRGTGRLFMGASTTPARCDLTIKTLLREVDRLAEDITEEELRRAKIGIIAKSDTHGDITRARLGELSSDVFHYGRPMSQAEKNERIEAVTIRDIGQYLERHPRDKLCILTVGPRAMSGGAA